MSHDIAISFIFLLVKKKKKCLKPLMCITFYCWSMLVESPIKLESPLLVASPLFLSYHGSFDPYSCFWHVSPWYSILVVGWPLVLKLKSQCFANHRGFAKQKKKLFSRSLDQSQSQSYCKRHQRDGHETKASAAPSIQTKRCVWNLFPRKNKMSSIFRSHMYAIKKKYNGCLICSLIDCLFMDSLPKSGHISI